MFTPENSTGKPGHNVIRWEQTPKKAGDTMDITQLRECYETYERDYRKALQKASPCAGLLGLGDSPKHAACHEIFYEKVGAWVAEFCASNPTAQEAAQAAELILQAAQLRRGQDTYWYCCAAQGHVLPLIELLEPETARKLQAWYQQAYPPVERMPVHKKIDKLLKKQAKTGENLPGRSR